MIEKGWDLEKTHSIRRLLAIAEEYSVRVPLTETDVTFIDGIYRGRYPMDAGLLPQGEPDGNDAQRAVEIALSLTASAEKSNHGSKA